MTNAKGRKRTVCPSARWATPMLPSLNHLVQPNVGSSSDEITCRNDNRIQLRKAHFTPVPSTDPVVVVSGVPVGTQALSEGASVEIVTPAPHKPKQTLQMLLGHVPALVFYLLLSALEGVFGIITLVLWYRDDWDHQACTSRKPALRSSPSPALPRFSSPIPLLTTTTVRRPQYCEATSFSLSNWFIVGGWISVGIAACKFLVRLCLHSHWESLKTGMSKVMDFPYEVHVLLATVQLFSLGAPHSLDCPKLAAPTRDPAAHATQPLTRPGCVSVQHGSCMARSRFGTSPRATTKSTTTSPAAPTAA